MSEKKQTILLVEDEAVIAEAQAEMFRRRGFKVIIALSGEKAVELFKNGNDIDLILMDIDLGKGMDGTEAAEIILKDHDIPVVFLSSHTEIETVEKTDKITSYGYVVKNCGETILYASISMAFRLFEAHKEIIKADQEMRTLAGEWQTTFDAISDIVWLLGPDFKIIRFNKASLKVFNKDILGRYCREIVFGVNSPPPDSPVVKMQKTKSRESAEIQSGGKWYSITADPILDPKGGISGAVYIMSDITDRKITEDALKNNSTLMRNIIDSSADYIYVKDPELRTILCNKVFSGALGKKPEDLFGKTDIENGWDPELVKGNPEKGIKGFEQDDLSALKGNTVEDPSEPGNVKGMIHYFDTIKLPLKDENGKIIGVLGVSRDITERKEAEDALRESEEQFRVLVENAPDAMFVQLKGKFAYLNNAALKLFGTEDVVELLGKPVLERFHPDYHSIIKERIQSLNVERKTVPIIEEKYIKMDGTVIDVEVSAVPIVYNNDQGGLVFARDITERKRVEEALQQSENKYRALFEHMQSGLAVYEAVDDGKDFIFREFNEAAEKISLVSSEKVIGERLSTIFPNMDKFGLFAALQRVYRTGVPELLPAAYYKDLIREGWRENFIYKLPSGELAVIYDDVTELMRTMESLKENEERFRLLVENAPYAIFVETKGFYAYLNNSAVKLFGAESSEQLIGHSLYERFHPDHHDIVKERLRLLNEERQSLPPAELKYLKIDGTPIDVEVSAVPIVYERENGALVFTRNITEHKKAEEALRKSEENYRALTESSPEIIFSVDRDFIVRFVNKTTAEKFQSKPEDIIGRHIGDVFKPSSAEGHNRAINHVLETGQTFVSEVLEEFPAGTCWIKTLLSPLKDAQGRVTGVLGLSQDISEQKKTEEALKISEALYRNLVETSPDGIVMTDLEGRVMTCNERFAKIFGYDDAEEMTGLLAFDTMAVEDQERARSNMEITFKKGIVKNVEYTLFKKDGSKFTAELSASLVKDSRGAPNSFVGVLKDITDRKKAEEALRESEQRYRMFVLNSTEGIGRWEINPPMPITLPEKEQLDYLWQNTFSAECNQTLSDFYKLKSIKDFPNRPLTDFMPESDPFNTEHLREFVRARYSIKNAESKDVDKNGKVHTMINNLTGIVKDGMLQRIWSIQRDVTEFNELQQELQEKNEIFRLFMEYSPVYVFFKDEDSKIVWLSKNYEKVLGKPVRELTGKSMYDIFPVEVAEKSVQDDRWIIRERKPAEFMGELNGRVYSTIEFPIILGEKSVLLAGFTTGITERKKMEDDLKKWAQLFEHAAWGVCIGSIDNNKLQFVNPAFAEMHGYTAEELVGKAFDKIVAPEVRDVFHEKIDMIQEKGQHTFENLHIRKDGTVFPALMNVAVVNDEKGKPLYKAVNVLDITERKLAEAALKENEEKFRTITETSRDWMWQIDVNGRHIYSNPTVACRFL